MKDTVGFVLRGLHVNQAQLEIVKSIKQIVELDDIRLITDASGAGTFLPGVCFGNPSLSALTLNTLLDERKHYTDYVTQLLAKYRLHHFLTELETSPDGKIICATFDAGDHEGVVSNIKLDIRHRAYLGIEQKRKQLILPFGYGFGSKA